MTDMSAPVMIKIDLRQTIRGTPDSKSVEVEVPALPRVGDHCGHDPSGINGCVTGVTFYWDEAGELTIEVRVQ